ncbi:response regulator [bacterium]|nr:response regulator [bacterium]
MDDKTVLIIEQRDDIRKKIESILKKKKEYKVYTEASAKNVLNKYADLVKNTDKIVLITGMLIDTIIDGEMAGINLIGKFKALNANLKGIVISHFEATKQFDTEMITLVTENIRRGAFDYILFPFDKTEFTKRIEFAFNVEQEAVYSYLQEREIVDSALKQIMAILEKERKLKEKAKVELKPDVLLKTIQEKGPYILFTAKELLEILGKEANYTLPEMPKSKILAVDDELRVRNLVKTFLDYKYNVILAEDAAKSLEQLENHPDIDIIILDIMLPDITGVDLIPKIQKINTTANIIMLTAYKDRELAIKSVRSGAINFLNKPFYKDSLVASVQQVEELRYYKKLLPELVYALGKKKLSPKNRFELLEKYLTEAKSSLISLNEIFIFIPEAKNFDHIDNIYIRPKEILRFGTDKFIQSLIQRQVKLLQAYDPKKENLEIKENYHTFINGLR